MSDRVMYVNGNPIKLVDNGDGTFSEGSTGVLKQRQVGDDLEFTFANEANANTQKSTTVEKPANPLMEYQLLIYNPSTTADITLNLYAVEEDLAGEGVDVEVLIDSFVAPKGTAHSVNLVGALFNGSDLKIVMLNNDALDADGGFTATVRIREVG